MSNAENSDAENDAAIDARVPGPADVIISSDDGRLRIVFAWDRDRFVQRLFVDDAQVGTSVEGDAETSWPPSPPIQQLSLERIADRDVILGVGGAGRGHWSISVEPVEGQTSALKFDLACRGGGEDLSLASTYRVNESVSIEAVEGEVSAAVDLVRVVPIEVWPVAKTHRWSYTASAR